MTNIQKIIFDSKYLIKYLNNSFVISGFNHVNSLHVDEEDINDVLESIHEFDEEQWEEFIKEYK